MGQFSWLDCVTGEQIFDDYERDSYVLVPREFRDTYGVAITEDCYDGYGRFGGYDIYDLVADWNKKYIDPDNFTSRCLNVGSEDNYGGLWPDEKEDLKKQGMSAKEINALDKAKKHEHWQNAVNRANKSIAKIRDFCEGRSDEYMKTMYGAEYKRNIGITLACYDEDNEKLHYPIKITYQQGYTYEQCDPSPSDPDQGWNLGHNRGM